MLAETGEEDEMQTHTNLIKNAEQKKIELKNIIKWKLFSAASLTFPSAFPHSV